MKSQWACFRRYLEIAHDKRPFYTDGPIGDHGANARLSVIGKKTSHSAAPHRFFHSTLQLSCSLGATAREKSAGATGIKRGPVKFCILQNKTIDCSLTVGVLYLLLSGAYSVMLSYYDAGVCFAVSPVVENLMVSFSSFKITGNRVVHAQTKHNKHTMQDRQQKTTTTFFLLAPSNAKHMYSSFST